VPRFRRSQRLLACFAFRGRRRVPTWVTPGLPRALRSARPRASAV
jgi:hypothetical protein